MARRWQFPEPVAAIGRALRDYLGGRRSRARPIVNRADLRQFLESRASYVCQMSLYGYLRTRTGVRFPELFADDVFVVSINQAKWHIWLACLSDITVYAGLLILRRTNSPAETVRGVMRTLLDEALTIVGTPDDAGPDFQTHAQRVRSRLALCDWSALDDDESAFSESPEALVRYAPVIDELKTLDAPIVRNSVRFRWQEVRRDLRRDLRAEAVLADAAQGAAP
jgi:hypothetical protein